MKIKKTLLLLVPLLILFISLWSDHSPNGFFKTSKEELSTSFTSYIHQVSGVKRLQVVEMTSNEVIQRTSRYTLFWNMIQLPDMVVLARIPTTYTYYIDLEEPISIETKDGKVILKISDLKAGVPAPDVSGISYEVKEGGLFRSSGQAFERLRTTITPLLKEKAEQNKSLAYEKAEQELKTLARMWAKKDFDSNVELNDIEILFEHQPAPVTH